MNADYRGSFAGGTPAIPVDSVDSRDDPRVASALAAYLAELEAGRRPSRDELLSRHSDIAEALADCLDVVEFVHSAARSSASDGLLPAPIDALPPDTILGEYRLVREIGRGATGIVYEAEQVSLARRVALKVLSGSAALDPLRLQRFQIETQALAQLHHPHIVPIFAVGSERGTYHYSMQYIDGTTLADLISQKRRQGQGHVEEPPRGLFPSGAGATPPSRPRDSDGKFTNGTGDGALKLPPSGLTAQWASPRGAGRSAFRALARLAVQAAEALEHAHALGILHRDIKPSNLLVDATGNLWVTDFGLARFQDEPGLTRTGDLLGTLRYIAPELVRGQQTVHDPRSDVYSLGATFYEILTLRPVFDGRDRQVLLRQITQEEPVRPSRVDPTIPRDLETIVCKAMDKEPDRRYATAQELALDLRCFLDDKPIRARRPTPAERTAKWARRHRAVLFTAATVAFLAMAVATPLLWWQERKAASMYQDLRVAFDQADLGFRQMIRLSDEMTVNGMARFAEPATSPAAQATRTLFFERAVEFYDRLVRDPQVSKEMRALGYQRLGLARMLGSQDPRAEDDLRHALALYEDFLAKSPRDLQLRFAISDITMNLGVYTVSSRGIGPAMPFLSRAIELDEGLALDFLDDPTYLEQVTSRRLQVAGWLESSHRATQADAERRQLLAFYDKAVSAAAPLPRRTHAMVDSYRRLAGAFAEQGRPRDQQVALRRALALEPDSPALLNDLAWALSLPPEAQPGESAEAIDLAKRALRANTKERAIWNTLGLAYLRAGQLQQATDAIRESIELHSQGGDAADRLVMAMVSCRRGDKTAALDWYVRALESLVKHPQPDPSLPTLRTEAERLLGRTPGGDAGPNG